MHFIFARMGAKKHLPRKHARRVGGLICAGLVLATGCEQPPSSGGYKHDLGPTLDRLVATYSDLESRRFQVLFDFEEPAQEALFTIESPGTPGAAILSTERARRETGVGALKMSLVRSSQRVVCSDSPESPWGLARDWSKHHLLLFSVFSPRKLGGFTFGVRSGTNIPLSYTHPRILLSAGWNLIRIDLGDLSDRIDVTDVRELQFGCDPLDTPVDLYLDDVILVDNARELFASPEREPGDLYVQARGRRLVVGSIDRFELVFAQGRILQWFDLGQDPARTRNLVGVGSLGPEPVVVPNDAKAAVLLDDATQWSGLGIAARVQQSLVETTALRVVVQGEWRFGSVDLFGRDGGPYHQWVWSVYRDGRVYVSCSGTARAEGFDPPGVGMVFCCEGGSGFGRHLVDSRPADESRPSAGQDGYLLLNRPERGEADLLIVPFVHATARTLENPHDPRLCTLFSMPVAQDRFAFSAMIRVWPPDIDSTEEAGLMAADYRHPLPIALDAGQLVRTDPGDFDNDGFSESGGYYVLQLDGSIAKVRIDGRRRLRFSPLFKLVDVADRDVWIYLDGRLLRETYRDVEGNVLFEVPGAISQEILIEVTSRVRESPAP